MKLEFDPDDDVTFFDPVTCFGIGLAVLIIVLSILCFRNHVKSVSAHPPRQETVVTNALYPQNVVLTQCILELYGRTLPPIIVTNFPDTTNKPKRHFQIMRSIH